MATSGNGLRAGDTGNHLLDALPADIAAALLEHAELLEEPRHQEVYPQDGRIRHVHFPTSAVLSTVLVARTGERSEVGTVGCEGMVGLPLYLGLDCSAGSIIVQVPGGSIRVPAAVFLRLVEQGNGLDQLMRRYTAYSLRFAGQSILCNALHSLHQRACRWLLMTGDRAGRDQFFITHELLAEMLGVRRQSVSLIAGALQRQGLIEYRRGRVTMRDRAGLEAASCECYDVIKAAYRELMP